MHPPDDQHTRTLQAAITHALQLADGQQESLIAAMLADVLHVADMAERERT
jgi:hypothetical protein